MTNDLTSTFEDNLAYTIEAVHVMSCEFLDSK